MQTLCYSFLIKYKIILETSPSKSVIIRKHQQWILKVTTKPFTIQISHAITGILRFYYYNFLSGQIKVVLLWKGFLGVILVPFVRNLVGRVPARRLLGPRSSLCSERSFDVLFLLGNQSLFSSRASDSHVRFPAVHGTKGQKQELTHQDVTQRLNEVQSKFITGFLSVKVLKKFKF